MFSTLFQYIFYFLFVFYFSPSISSNYIVSICHLFILVFCCSRAVQLHFILLCICRTQPRISHAVYTPFRTDLVGWYCPLQMLWIFQFNLLFKIQIHLVGFFPKPYYFFFWFYFWVFNMLTWRNSNFLPE